MAISEKDEKIDKIYHLIAKYNIDGIEGLIDIVEKHVNNKSNLYPIQDTKEIKVLEQKEKKVVDELKAENVCQNEFDNISILTEKICNLSIIIDENNKKMSEMENVHKKEMDKLKKEYEAKLFKKTSISSNSKDIPIKDKSTQNCLPDFDKLSTYKIILLSNPDTKVKQKIGKRTYEFLNFYKEIIDLDKIESNDKFNSLDNCTEYILKSKGLPLSKQNKYNWKKNITRCSEIFNLFKDKLVNVYYNINNIRYIKNEYWEEWKNYVKNKINDFYKTKDKCVPDENKSS